jgi:hypothetical protein
MTGDIKSLQLLYGRRPITAGFLTNELAEWYGGQLDLPMNPEQPYVIGNFVTSLDAAIEPTDRLFGYSVDRALMSVLRAWAEAVVIGRGTLEADPKD